MVFYKVFNLHLVDGEDAHPLESNAKSSSPDSVPLARVQRTVQQLNSAILKGDFRLELWCTVGQEMCSISADLIGV